MSESNTEVVEEGWDCKAIYGNPLTNEQKIRLLETLERCECPNFSSSDNPEEVGAALKAIRDEKLYRSEYNSFGEYCLFRWGLSSEDIQKFFNAKNGVRPAPESTRTRRVIPLDKIYFAECVGQGLVKIGFSKSANDRLANLQMGCPFELKLLAIIDGSVKSERELHNRFKTHHIRGEWFRLVEEIRRFIAAAAGEQEEAII